ncbi:MAG: DsbA family protein, partial [Nitrososphaerales archaeon]
AEAAAAQGKFWEMHDFLYENQVSLGDEAFFAKYENKLMLDTTKLGREVAQHVHSARIQEDYMSGIKSGVNGTPTFFINGARYDGYPGFVQLVAALKEAGKASG